MAKLSQMKATKAQKVLIYGPPKVGKTELAGELARHPEIAGIIWVDLESGVETLLKLPPEAQEKIIVISLPDTRHNPVAVQTCLKLVRGTKVAICEEHGVVDCAICKKNKIVLPTYELGKLPGNWIVVFDSITQFTDSCMAFIAKDKSDDYKFLQDDWGDLAKLISVFLGHVQQAAYHCICISHEVEAEREDGTSRVVPVAGSKNSSRNSAKYFGHVIYAQVKAKKHVFTSGTTSMDNIVAGSRTDLKLEGTPKDERPTLFPIFEAAARGASNHGSEATEVTESEGNAPDQGAEGLEVLAQAEGHAGGGATEGGEKGTDSPAEEQTAAEGIPEPDYTGMTALERIRAKRAWETAKAGS